MANHYVYRFNSKLVGCKPKIWRNFRVDGDKPLDQLAYVIMALYEMDEGHLFNFEDRTDGELISYEMSPGTRVDLCSDATRYSVFDRKIRSVINEDNPQLMFVYDFGCNWEVLIELQHCEIVDDLTQEMPQVEEGEGYGIIEDLQGVEGLMRFKQMLESADSNDYQYYCDWFEGQLPDLSNFDLAKCNSNLHDKITKLENHYRIGDY
ncbi:plasmid pRiA4b ORF-3 family protein [Xylocopilactobacillus apicola]|uniref:Plasmid pRiA4b Orf3-like domain-containing protein n=1 Tax=Xylocopilactobacillus apicola TaxID=2932184 RepID=A0AAU9D6R8_9LACO|nr:plasmid pRiA4b ORF-3 family protein [Xylocopilactobacillus apicola]BDR57995.1 hypothetical protein XA3_04360 [Xylocopilactobacillus apicola]